MTLSRRSLLFTGPAATLSVAGCARQRRRPLRIIVPLSVGSTGDMVARKLAGGLGKALGRPAFVENVPGAGGIVGTTKIAKARPDGNTIGIVTSSYVINPGIYRHMPFDPVKDITPIAVIGDSPQVLLAHPSLGVHTLAELIALAKAKPGFLHYGSSGNGTGLHLLGVKLTKDAGLSIDHVPYNGNTPLVAALLGGQVPMAFQSTTQAAPYVKAGKLVALGVTSKVRSRLLPDVPTLAEQGFSDFDLSVWMGVIGPASLAAPEVDQINQAVNLALTDPVVAGWFRKQDWRLTPMTPAEAKTFFQAEQVKYLQIIKQSGAKLR